MNGERVVREALYDHREGALTCYDHLPTPDRALWCCVCGEHEIGTTWRWHVARQIVAALSDADHNPREEADKGARAGERGASGTRGHGDAARPADRSTRAQGDV